MSEESEIETATEMMSEALGIEIEVETVLLLEIGTFVASALDPLDLGDNCSY